MKHIFNYRNAFIDSVIIKFISSLNAISAAFLGDITATIPFFAINMRLKTGVTSNVCSTELHTSRTGLGLEPQRGSSTTYVRSSCAPDVDGLASDHCGTGSIPGVDMLDGLCLPGRY